MEVEDIVELTERKLKKLDTWIQNLIENFEKPYYKLDKTMQLAKNLNDPGFAQRLQYSVPEAKARLLYMLTDPDLISIIEQTATRSYNGAGELSVGFNFDSNIQKDDLQEVQDQIQSIEAAILVILSYIQSEAEYINVVQHMSNQPTHVHDQIAGEQRLYNGLGVYGRSKLQRLKNFKLFLDDKNYEVIYPKRTQPNTPFRQTNKVLKL